MKRRAKFPVVGRGEASYPGATWMDCPMCGKKMVDGGKVEQVVLTVGALRRESVKRDAWAVAVDCGGIMSISTHAHNSRMPHASVDVVDLAANGQADLAFCSTECLRVFFGSVVDEMERKMRRNSR